MNLKTVFIVGFCLALSILTHAQVNHLPNAFSYQAVVRTDQGKVVAEQTVGFKIELLQGAVDGTVIYAETHTCVSSKTGTVNLLVGKGEVTAGTFEDIDWGASVYFMRTSVDLEGGNNYKVVSTTQMMPVPYALYAITAGAVREIEDPGPVPTPDPVPDDGKIKYGRDFILSQTDDSLYQGGLFSAMGTGIVEVIDPYSSYPAETTIEFNIQYLVGYDMNLSAEMDGYEQTFKIQSAGQSSIIGRYCRFNIIRPDGASQVQTTLRIRDDKNQEIISFPITINYVNK